MTLAAVGVFFMPAAAFGQGGGFQQLEEPPPLDGPAPTGSVQDFLDDDSERNAQILPSPFAPAAGGENRELTTPDPTATGLFSGVTIACWQRGTCTLCDGLLVFVNIANTILRFLAIVATIFFVYGAGLMMLSQGNEDWVSRGKAAMKATIVGVIITLIAWQLMSVIVFVLANQQQSAFGDTRPQGTYNPLTSWYTVAEQCGRVQAPR